MLVSLELATAQAQWKLNENDNQWDVVDKEGNHLWWLPAHFKEKDVMTAIHLGREFELKAFNIGIQYGKQQSAQVANLHTKRLESEVTNLMQLNERLSDQLARHIAGET